MRANYPARSAGFGGYGPAAVVGGVNYDYAMGKYDVTAGQYCAFLNAVAAHGSLRTVQPGHGHR